MISFSRMETVKIDEKILFENLKSYLFEDNVYDSNGRYIDTVIELPGDVQRLIFAKIGAMFSDYAENEDF